MQILLTLLIFLNAAAAHAQSTADNSSTAAPVLIVNQFAKVNPQDLNPVDYEDKIENSVYQSGDRLIVIQSIPIKYIKEAVEPNIQPTINDFPSL